MSVASRPASVKPEPGNSSMRTLAANGGPRPSPQPATSSSNGAPSKSSSNNDLKRKRTVVAPALTDAGIYSQPADTGTGQELMTQVVYATEYLRSKDRTVGFAVIFNYLSIPAAGDADQVRRNLEAALRRHPKVEYLEDRGLFRFRPTHNVRSGDELRAYLQAQRSGQGVLVRELKDGWSGAADAIAALEAENAILVTRNKKDQTPKMVWANDPSLSAKVDVDFKELFHRTRLPEREEEMSGELERAGLTPTSKVHNSALQKGQKQKEKKRRAPRSGGRTTNIHMMSILKDYSDRKK